MNYNLVTAEQAKKLTSDKYSQYAERQLQYCRIAIQGAIEKGEYEVRLNLDDSDVKSNMIVGILPEVTEELKSLGYTVYKDYMLYTKGLNSYFCIIWSGKKEKQKRSLFSAFANLTKKLMNTNSAKQK